MKGENVRYVQPVGVADNLEENCFQSTPIVAFHEVAQPRNGLCKFSHRFARPVAFWCLAIASDFEVKTRNVTLAL